MNGPSAADLFDQAVRYAKADYSVLPLHTVHDGRCSCGNPACKSPGKHPRLAHGVKAASSDPDTVAEFWTRYPDSNIGIATGGSIGLVVLDIDGPEGEASLAALEAEHGPLPPTAKATTGKGWHLWYQRAADDPPVPSRVGVRPGLDIRGEGGYVVAPPSRHVSGKIYTWVETMPLARLPLCLVELGARRASLPAEGAPQGTLDQAAAAVAAPPAYSDAEVARIREALAGIPVTDRENRETWLKVGCALNWLNESPGWDAEVTFSIWDEWSREGDHKKFDAADQLKTWQSFGRDYDGEKIKLGTIFHLAKEHGWRPSAEGPEATVAVAQAEAEPAPAGDAREPYPAPNPDLLRLQFTAPPFPKDIIPTSWWPWVSAAAEGAGAPVDYVALALFAGVAGLIGNARRASPWPQWVEAIALDVALVGDPSSNKSPAADPIRNLLVMLEGEQNQDWAARWRQYEHDLAVAKAKQRAWEKKLKAAMKAGESAPARPAGADAPKRIHKRRLFSNSPTQEQAARLSEQNPRGMTLFRDELSGWIGEADRYASGASPGSDRVFWTEAYGGRYWGADRVDQARDVAVPHLLWTIFGGIQPSRLPELFGGNNDGMAARFIYTWPNALPPKIPTGLADMDMALGRLRRLVKLSWEAPEPKLIPLTKAAAEAIHDWQNEVMCLSKPATGLFQGWLGKLPGLCLRLATVLTYLEWCGGSEAGPERTQIEARAIAQARYFLTAYAIPMARRTFGETALPEEERDARMIARWLVVQDPVPEVINERDLARRPDGPAVKASKRLAAALELLAEEGWVRPPIGKSGPAGGRPRKDWAVSPAVATKLPDGHEIAAFS
jgi:hypothetical protein